MKLLWGSREQERLNGPTRRTLKRRNKFLKVFNFPIQGNVNQQTKGQITFNILILIKIYIKN